MSSEEKDVPQNTQDLTVFVQNLLQQMVCAFLVFLCVGALFCCARTRGVSPLASVFLVSCSCDLRQKCVRARQQQRFQDMSDAIIQRSASTHYLAKAPHSADARTPNSAPLFAPAGSSLCARACPLCATMTGIDLQRWTDVHFLWSLLPRQWRAADMLRSPYYCCN